MLSLPEDWDYTLSGLARISLEGKDAIRAAVVEPEPDPTMLELPGMKDELRRPMMLLVKAAIPKNCKEETSKPFPSRKRFGGLYWLI